MLKVCSDFCSEYEVFGLESGSQVRLTRKRDSKGDNNSPFRRADFKDVPIAPPRLEVERESTWYAKLCNNSVRAFVYYPVKDRSPGLGAIYLTLEWFVPKMGLQFYKG